MRLHIDKHVHQTDVWEPIYLAVICWTTHAHAQTHTFTLLILFNFNLIIYRVNIMKYDIIWHLMDDDDDN